MVSITLESGNCETDYTSFFSRNELLDKASKIEQ